MTSYSEEEIRYALKGRTDLETDHLLRVLRNNREKPADDGTFTAKEIREAWRRLQLDVPFPGPGGRDAVRLLQDILSNREPEYPVNSVWKDANGMVWLRVADDGGGWACFGSAGTYSLNSPKRPLKRMDVI